MDSTATPMLLLRLPKIGNNVQKGRPPEVLVPRRLPSTLPYAPTWTDVSEVHTVPLLACGRSSQLVVRKRHKEPVPFAKKRNAGSGIARLLDVPPPVRNLWFFVVVLRYTELPLQLYPGPVEFVDL